jgi:hypothetical protein
VEQELGLVLEAGVPDLLFGPLERWMIGDVQVDDLSICELHDDEDVENTKPNRLLHKEVTGPHGFGLVLQKASPGAAEQLDVIFETLFPPGVTDRSSAQIG